MCDEPQIPLEAKEAFYSIAQEALHNIVKHAHANHCQLSLFEHQGTIVLEVRDDGIGFDTSAAFPCHLGLHSMRERAIHLGGTLEIRSIPAEGTLVRAVLPFSKQ
jgi:signal transduction histidine kinase